MNFNANHVRVITDIVCVIRMITEVVFVIVVKSDRWRLSNLTGF